MAVTDICGGTMSGNCAIGICVSAMAPASVMTIEMTTDSLGRSMKMLESIDYTPGLASAAWTTCPGLTF
ncbi:MAG: hypothetical protein WCG92_00850 [Hyphomicrobiales bacterium]